MLKIKHGDIVTIIQCNCTASELQSDLALSVDDSLKRAQFALSNFLQYLARKQSTLSHFNARDPKTWDSDT